MTRHTAETYHGNPCLRGHLGLRYAVNSGCVACARERMAAKRKNRPGGPVPRPEAERLVHKVTTNLTPGLGAELDRRALRQGVSSAAIARAILEAALTSNLDNNLRANPTVSVSRETTVSA